MSYRECRSVLVVCYSDEGCEGEEKEMMTNPFGEWDFISLFPTRNEKSDWIGSIKTRPLLLVHPWPHRHPASEWVSNVENVISRRRDLIWARDMERVSCTAKEYILINLFLCLVGSHTDYSATMSASGIIAEQRSKDGIDFGNITVVIR